MHLKKQDIVKEIVKNIGLLDDHKIRAALDEQFETKERLVKILVRLGYVANESVGNTLVPQIGILPIAIKIEDIDPAAVNIIPSQLASNHRIIPFKIENKTLFLATDDPINFLASDFFEKITNLDIDMTLANKADIDKALVELYASKQKEKLQSDLNKL